MLLFKWVSHRSPDSIQLHQGNSKLDLVQVENYFVCHQGCAAKQRLPSAIDLQDKRLTGRYLAIVLDTCNKIRCTMVFFSLSLSLLYIYNVYLHVFIPCMLVCSNPCQELEASVPIFLFSILPLTVTTLPWTNQASLAKSIPTDNQNSCDLTLAFLLVYLVFAMFVSLVSLAV